MQYQPLVSIIVPVYKAEIYLRECIDSLLNIKYSNFEILLIDDGSPDNSGIICDEYAIKDSRIRVFHKENGGVSSARNLGLDNVKGEWVAFVDSDDYVSKSFLDEFNFIDDTFDLIKFGFRKEEKWGVVTVGPKEINIIEKTNIDINSFWSSVSCSFFFSKYIIDKYNIRLSSNVKYSEDREFILKYLLFVNKVYVSDNKPYFYRLNLSSAVNTRRTYERCCDDLRVIDNIFSFIENEKIDLDIHRLKLIEFFISLSVKSFVFNLGLNKINIKKNKAIDDLNSVIKKIENYNINIKYPNLIFQFLKKPKYIIFKIWFRHQFAYVYHRYLERK